MIVNFSSVADGVVTWEFGDGSGEEGILCLTLTWVTQPWKNSLMAKSHGHQ